MSQTTRTEDRNRTSWLGSPVVPEGYDDLAQLVATARAVRGRLVSFQWTFGEDDLRSLQRAVYEWGSASAGRYRVFDARLLQAVNEALQDNRSIFALRVPPRPALPDCIVTCTRDDGRYLVAGHAPFDIVFGYGSAGVTGGPAASHYLTDAARAMLSGTVAKLGWNLPKLHEREYRAALNALYGMPLAYGVPAGAVATGTPATLDLRFHGPFALTNGLGSPCLFEQPIAKQGGIYVWTIPAEGLQRAWYVGQTQRAFSLRLAEHVACFLSGEYTVYDPEALVRGEHRLAEGAMPVRWPDTLPEFLGRADVLVPRVLDLLRIMRVHLAPMAADGRLLNRIEGAIARHYQRHADQVLRAFFGPGIRVPAAIPYDRPLRVAISMDAPIAGMPTELPA